MPLLVPHRDVRGAIDGACRGPHVGVQVDPAGRVEPDRPVAAPRTALHVGLVHAVGVDVCVEHVGVVIRAVGAQQHGASLRGKLRHTEPGLPSHAASGVLGPSSIQLPSGRVFSHAHREPAVLSLVHLLGPQASARVRRAPCGPSSAAVVSAENSGGPLAPKRHICRARQRAGSAAVLRRVAQQGAAVDTDVGITSVDGKAAVLRRVVQQGAAVDNNVGITGADAGHLQDRGGQHGSTQGTSRAHTSRACQACSSRGCGHVPWEAVGAGAGRA
mmetsp:Transcript_52170/g.138565  ORF Transcript_52170/g.138565 Transcript_52170/m.138565 type:complete len:273 (-) Transcript_52170:3-821(-)